MANRYWVGGMGNWSDNTSHWSDTSGGSPGASVPTSADSVYFDVNSFTTTGQYVITDDVAYCLDMDWTGVLNNPTWSNPAGKGTLIYGSLILTSNMILTGYAGYCTFESSTSGNTITTAGKNVYRLRFYGVGGGWILQDDVIMTSSLEIRDGSLNTNNKNISCSTFDCSGTNTRSLILGSSAITSPGNITFASTGLTFNAGTSKFIMTGASRTFAGGGLTYNNVEFQGTPTTITGSNTFNELKIDSGKTVNITAGTTQIITTLIADGATLQSTSSGSPFTISKTNGITLLNDCSIQDSIATGGAKFLAKDSTNVSGNTGWIFAPVAQLALATTSVGGFLSASDKTKLDGLSTNASDITITDSGGLITATDVEGALQEIVTAFNSEKADTVYQVAGGTATAITLTISGTLVDGYPLTFIASANNSGAATTINTKSLYKPGGTSAPTLVSGKAYTVWYDESGDNFFIKASAEGDAVAGDVLAGKKFSNDNDTGLTGTMTNRGAVTITPGTGNQTIAMGYHDGAGYVLGDADLLAGNIKSGVNLFGVSGTYTGPSIIQSIQRGTFYSSNANSISFDITISSVNISKAIVILTYTYQGGSSVSPPCRYFPAAVLTGSTTLNISVPGPYSEVDARIEWQVIEFISSAVKSLQRGTSTPSQSNVGFTATISSVNTSKSFLVFSFTDSSQNSEYGSSVGAKGYISSSTQLTFQARNTTTTVKWQVIEFN